MCCWNLSCVRPGQGSFSPEARREHRRAGWTKVAKQNRVFDTMCCHAGFRWGNWVGVRQSRLGRAQGTGQWELLCPFCCLFCVFSLSVSLLLLFALFAVLLNCPYPDPPVICLFLSILLPTPVGGGAAERPRGALLPATAKLQQNLLPSQYPFPTPLR